jgi:hypothetical protein
MDAHLWHRQATRKPPVLPDPLSKSELSHLTEDARVDYTRRLRAGLRRQPLTSPIHDAVAEQMSAALQSASLDPPGARTILSLSAPYAAGKSTIVKRWAQGLHRSWLPDGDHRDLPRWSPSPGILADVIPVNYMTLLADSRGTDLYAQLLSFANADAGGAVRTIVQRAVNSMRRHGTRLVIIDDAHMLRTASVTGRATLNAVKHLNTELGELGGVLVLVGANLTGGDVVEDEQIRGRLSQHSFDAYEIDSDSGRRDWQRFLKSCEQTLLPYLPRNQAGDFAMKHSTYLWVRTTGFVGDASRLLIDATAEALIAGKAVDRDILGRITLSQRAKDAERDLRGKKTSAAPVRTAAG